MTAAEAFAAIENYYLQLYKPRVEALAVAQSNEEIIRLCKEILAVTRDEEIDGIAFPVITIDGHDQECVKGTVLDTTKPSLAYLPYRHSRVCCDCILSILTERRRGDWFGKWLTRYQLPFQSATVENCIAQLQVAAEQFHGKDGVFAQANALAVTGEWRNG